MLFIELLAVQQSTTHKKKKKTTNKPNQKTATPTLSDTEVCSLGFQPHSPNIVEGQDGKSYENT